MATKLKPKFDAAVAASKQLPEKPDNATLLQIYSLFKQATEGDVTGKRPGMLDMVGRAKFDAWEKQKGMSSDEAMKAYIELIESLK
jgi:acyl-CoA-binding protein